MLDFKYYKLFLATLLLFVSTQHYSQVSLHTTKANTTLDIVKSSDINYTDGLAVPRVTGDNLGARNNVYTSAQNSAVVYVTQIPTQTTTKTDNVKRPGYYYYDAKLEKWMSLNHPKFFYMPPIAFDTTVFGVKTINLYDIYYNEFNSPKKSSTGSVGKIPTVGSKDLEYYVTYYDSSVFSNISISETGVMNYTVKQNASDQTYINIVFVLK